MDKGVFVAATHHIEWLLPWWWYNYRAHNDLAVAFIDMGLSSQARSWCESRGQVITLDTHSLNVKDKSFVESHLAKKWEELSGSGLWEVRKHWFKKPFAFSLSPFSVSLWIDLDCEVRGSIIPLFSHVDNPLGLALAREPSALIAGFQALGFCLPEEIIYNSGVVVFTKNSPILSSWVKEVQERNEHYIGDQDALSRILFHEKNRFTELSPLYNWDRGLGPNPDAHIFHWHGQQGKELIKQQMEALLSLGFSFAR
jgi:hypothetical protein